MLAIPGGLHRWGAGRASREVRLNLAPERALILPFDAPNDPTPNVIPLDPYPLLRRLDLVMTAGTLKPEQYQLIREALERVTFPQWNWPTERLRLAIWLVASSPEFNVLR